MTLRYMKIEVEEKGIKKIIFFNPDNALAVEEKHYDIENVLIYHFSTFKIVIISDQEGKIKSVNIIDRENCYCSCD